MSTITKNENFYLLEILNEKSRKTILDNSSLIIKEKDEIVFNESQNVESLFFIKKGNIKLSRYDISGREEIIGIFGKNEIIWESLFLDNAKYPYSGIAINHLELIKISKSQFEKEIKKSEDANIRLISLLSKKLHDANERNMIISKNNPLSKIAGFFLYRIARENKDIVYCRLNDIASSLNLRIETVSRKIKELINLNIIIKISQSGYKIIDRQKLQNISQI